MSDIDAMVQETAKKLMEKYNFITTRDNEQVFVYHSLLGVYVDGAIPLIKENIENMIKEKASPTVSNRILEKIKWNTYKYRSEFDSVDGIINVSNGLLNLNTMKLERHSPEFLSLRQIPVIYNPGADCPKFKKFLSEVTSEDNITTLKKFQGFLLTPGYDYAKALMLVGPPRGGKSTYAEVIRTFLGGEMNVSAQSLVNLTGNRFCTWHLYGKIANIRSEISAESIKQVEMFKSLTGNDVIYGEKKGVDGFDFKNSAKIMFTCNEVPPAPKGDAAYYGRWIIVNFPNKFIKKDANTNLRNELTTLEELSGILNFSIEGYRELRESGGFDELSEDEARNQYNRYTDSTVTRFINEKLILNSDCEYETKDDIFKEYEKYCLHNDLHGHVDNRWFWKEANEKFNLKEREVHKRMTDGSRVYVITNIEIRR